MVVKSIYLKELLEYILFRLLISDNQPLKSEILHIDDNYATVCMLGSRS